MVSVASTAITLAYSLRYTEETSVYRHRAFAPFAFQLLVLVYMTQQGLPLMHRYVPKQYIDFGVQFLDVVAAGLAPAVAILIVFITGFTDVVDMSAKFIALSILTPLVIVAHTLRSSIKDDGWFISSYEEQP